MPLDQCQMFKAAVLGECAKEGLTIEESHAAVKQAMVEMEKQAGDGWKWQDQIPFLSQASSMASSAAEKIPGLGMAAYIGGPIAVGAAGGVAAAKLRGINDIDPDEVKEQEKIEAYRRAADRARLQRRLRVSREGRRPSRPLL